LQFHRLTRDARPDDPSEAFRAERAGACFAHRLEDTLQNASVMLQRPPEQRQFMRIAIEKPGLSSKLEPTRGIEAFQPAGITHKPWITRFPVPRPEGVNERVFLVMVTDGVTKSFPNDVDIAVCLSHALHANPLLTLGALSEHLVTQAVHHGAEDNVSVVLKEFLPKPKATRKRGRQER
jgi:serine/threonine protein phosphatase PrpC